MPLAAGILSLLLFAAPQRKAGEPVLTVQGPEPGVVRLGDTSVATIVVEGVSVGATIEPPKAPADLEVRISGPSQMSQSFYDGRTLRTSLSLSWKLLLRPAKEGVFEIPPVTVKIGTDVKLETAPIRLECVKDLTGSKYAFLEAVFSKERYFAHEPVRLTLRFGIDRAIRGNMLQLFNRPLDVEVQVEGPWLQEFPGGVAVEAAGRAAGDRRLSCAVNQSLVEVRAAGEVERNGRTFVVYELERAWLPGKLGALELSAPLLRFRFATRFTTDFFGERIAADRHDAFVYGAPVKLEIVPLPDEGRPAAFTGAVGKFQIAVSASPRQVKVGESIHVKMVVTGEGNLEFFEPPALGNTEGFHAFGRLDDKAKDARTITYHLAPLEDSVREVPPIEFAYFDPGPPPAYRTIRTAAIPITVKPLPPGETLAPLADGAERRFTVGVDDIHDIMPLTESHGVAREAPPLPAAIAAFAGPLLLAAATWTWLRRRDADMADPARVRARRAHARFRASARDAAAFATYLADRLGCTEAAVLSEGLTDQLTSRGVPPDLARRAADALLTAVAARYAGGTAPGAAAREGNFEELARRLEERFEEGRS